LEKKKSRNGQNIAKIAKVTRIFLLAKTHITNIASRIANVTRFWKEEAKRGPEKSANIAKIANKVTRCMPVELF